MKTTRRYRKALGLIIAVNMVSIAMISCKPRNKQDSTATNLNVSRNTTNMPSRMETKCIENARRLAEGEVGITSDNISGRITPGATQNYYAIKIHSIEAADATDKLTMSVEYKFNHYGLHSVPLAKSSYSMDQVFGIVIDRNFKIVDRHIVKFNSNLYFHHFWHEYEFNLANTNDGKLSFVTCMIGRSGIWAAGKIYGVNKHIVVSR